MAMAGITATIGLIVSAFNNAKEAAKAAAQTIRDSFGSALDKTEAKLNDLLKLFGRLKKEQGIAISDKSVEADINASDAAIEIRRRHIQSRSTMTSDYDKARDKAAESREIGVANLNAKKEQSDINVKAKERELSVANGMVSTIAQTLKDEQNKVATQFASTVDSGVREKLKQLEDEVLRAQKEVQAKGKDATSDVKVADTSFGPNQFGQTRNATYGEVLERAATALNFFKEKHEDEIKNIEAYDKSLQRVKELEDKLADEKVNQQKASSDYANAQKKNAQLQKETQLEIERLEEAYKEQIAAIDKQEKSEKDAAEQRKKVEEDRKKAEEKRKAKEAKRAEIEGKIDNVQEKREQTLEDANAKEKALTEQEKKLADELKRAQDAAKGMKAGFDAAAEIANAMGKDNPWQGAQNAQGGVNQWIGANNRAANEAKKEAGRIGANVRAAEGQQGQLANRVFDKNGNIRKGANIMDIGRFTDVSDFLGGKGVSKEQREGLQAQADELRKRLFDENGNLKKSVNPRSRDVQQLEKIEGLLGKFKKLDDVKKKQEELKKVEDEKKKLQEDTAKATKQMAVDIKGLRSELKQLTSL